MLRISDLKKFFRKMYRSYAVLGNGVEVYLLNDAITADTTTTDAPAGSLAVTSHATGSGTLFFSDGEKWQIQTVVGEAVKGSGAEITTGTEDTKFVTAKALADAGVNKAIGPDIAGTSAKATPIDADLFVIADSASSNAGKKVTLAELKAVLKTYFDTLYEPIDGE